MQEQWWYKQNEKISGPESLETLGAMLAKGILPNNSLVWSKTLGAWTTADKVPELLAAQSQRLQRAKHPNKASPAKGSQPPPRSFFSRFKWLALVPLAYCIIVTTMGVIVDKRVVEQLSTSGSDVKLKRGMFQSTATSTLSAGGYTLSLVSKIHHGPFPSLSSIGLARVASTPMWSNKQRRELAAVFGTKEPITFETIVGLSNQLSTRIFSPAIEKAILTTGEEFAWGGISGNFDHGGNERKLMGQLSIPNLSIRNPSTAQNPSKKQISLRGLEFKVNLVRALTNLYSGDTELNFAELNFLPTGAPTTSPMYSGPAAVESIRLVGMSYKGNEKIVGNSSSSLGNFHLKSMIIGGAKPINMKNFTYEFSLDQLPAKPLDEMYAAINRWYIETALENGKKSLKNALADADNTREITQTLMKKFPELLTLNPIFTIKKFSFSTEQGGAAFNGRVALTNMPSTPIKFEQLLPTILKNIEANLNLSVDKQLVSSQAPSAGSSTEPSTAGSPLQSMIHAGYLTDENQLYKTNFVYKNGAATFNGKSLNLPFSPNR